ncbi:RNA-dependent RNA polymerase [Fusarium poae narnavirus 1]|uniref:RNA-dependent RNA polymerase n=1 Tax=Fusarium poae narnavirus 1 TaxID=1849531 RepID=UPI000847E43F|nr:RNA-dependent RNA polymerase [Fusarium poae narnavirus 1]BAV56295.1 RNA-dependent RNA polymerase [Fusarium poae narnavirus 1]
MASQFCDSIARRCGEVIRITLHRSNDHTTSPPHGGPRLEGNLETFPPAKRDKHAKRVMQAFYAAYIAMGYHCHLRDRSLTRFFEKLYIRAWHEGLDRVCPDIKKQVTLLRSALIAETGVSPDVLGKLLPRSWANLAHPRKLFQLTCLGRALPRPTQKVIESSKREALDGFTSPASVTTDINVLHELVPMALNLRRYSAKADTTIFRGSSSTEQSTLGPVFGTSATLFNSRKEGGRAGIIHDACRSRPRQVGAIVALKRQAAIRKTAAPLRFDIRSLKSEPLIGEDSRRVLNDVRHRFPNNLGESEIAVVPELGFKARVVTKSHPITVVAGHQLRRRLYPTLYQSRVFSRALGDKPKALRFARRSGAVFFSADLSRATDGLSHHTVGVFCRNAEIDPDIIFRNMSVDGHALKRGIFMGLPMSWTILSYIHRAVCDSVDPIQNYYLKGDDLVAHWTARQISLYRERVASVGMPLNESKTFVGPRKAVFCEGYYESSKASFNKKRMRTEIWLVRQPSISLRRFFPDSEAAALRLSEGLDEVDYNLRSQYNRLVYCFYPNYIRISRKIRLNPFLPPQLGGSGLLIPDLNSQVHSVFDRMRLNSIFGGVKRFNASIPVGGSSSNMKQVNILLSRVRMVPRGSGLTCSHFDKWLEFATSAAAFRDAKIGIFPKDPSDHTFFAEAKRISRDRRRGVDFPIDYRTVRSVCRSLEPLLSTVPLRHTCE